MGTIDCTVNGPNGTLTFNSISGPNPRNTWVEFDQISFEISGGGSFGLEFTVPYSTFRFNTTDPIDWGSTGPPAWITVVAVTAESLTLQAGSGTAGTSVFTIRNATPGGKPIGVTLQSTGGSGGAGGTIEAYLGDDQRALIGPLPAGALAAGSDVSFGLRDPGVNEIVLSPGEGTELLGLTWDPSMPAYIGLLPAGDQITITVDNVTTIRMAARFTIETNFGPIDPTIVTNPDESAP